MSQHAEVSIRPIIETDRHWVIDFYRRRWGSDRVVSRGVVHEIANLPGYIAWKGSQRVGSLTYAVSDRGIEIVTVDSLIGNIGIGTGLIDKVIKLAIQDGIKRIWLITTNDNMHALRFYQMRGFQIAGIRKNAIEQSRKLKPEIPELGLHGIPIRDEIELELYVNA